MKRLLSGLATLIGIGIGMPAQAASPQHVPDPIDSAISASAKKPVGETVIQIAKLLSERELAIPSPNTEMKGTSAQFLTAQDKEGQIWLYVYSDIAHVNRVMPNGTMVFTLSLTDLKKIIDANKQFRGIYVNSAYPVPRELFGMFFSVLP